MTNSKQEIQKLQDELVKLNYMTREQVKTGYGIYGPKTTAAFAKYEADKKSATLNHPDINPLVSGFKTDEEKWNAVHSAKPGAIASVNKPGKEGKVLSPADQQAAYAEAASVLDPGYQAEQAKNYADTETSLKDKQDAYNNYLATSGANFEADKAKLDQNAADKGVLFSGGRSQKETNLKSSYERADQAKLSGLTSDVGTVSRDFQYKYGNNPANGLSQYYGAKSNTYNPGVASGGVGQTGLSSVYNVGSNNFVGTAASIHEKKKQQYAGGLLWNKANNIVPGGSYNNQYKN